MQKVWMTAIVMLSAQTLMVVSSAPAILDMKQIVQVSTHTHT